MTRLCTGGSSCSRTARAAYAVTALERAETRLQRRVLLPDNVGQPGTADEETRLVEASKAGQTPKEIARRLPRTLRAVEAWLQRVGMISAEERTTREGFAAGD